MANPFLQGIPNPMGNMGQMIQQLQQFLQTFQGDPKAEVQKLLQSGRMTQAQLNQLQSMAQQIRPFL